MLSCPDVPRVFCRRDECFFVHFSLGWESLSPMKITRRI